VSITSTAINNNRVTAVVVFFVLLGGYMAYMSASRAEDPGFPIRTAMVQTIFPGASPERVEQLVTDKIEKAVQEIPQLDNVTSISKTGVSTIFVNIKESHKERELRAIWDSLRRKVDSIRGQLPEGVIGPHVDDEFGDVFGIVIGLTGDGFDAAELHDVAEEVRDELLRLPDAAKVEIYGSHEERIFLEFKDERLAELGTSPAQLQQVLESQNIVTPGGRIRNHDERYALEPTGNFETVEDIGQTVIQLPGRSELLRLIDVMEVRRGYLDPPVKEFRSTGTTGLGLAVSMRDGGNVMDLGDQVSAKVQELESRYPIGIELDVLIYQPKDVARLVEDFTGNLGQAVIIVMLAMVLFLGLRTGIVVAALIPTAIAGALVVMSVFGIGLDQMSLASLIIALGMLVDNAVVMAESTMVQMSAGKTGKQAAIDSAKELRTPLLISSLTTCVAFLPIFLAESSTGEYTAPLFKVVTITLLCSWILAITMTPLLCATFLKAPRGTGESYAGAVYRIYRAVLARLLRHRWLSLACVVVIFGIGMQGFRYIPNIFFPPSDNPSFIVKLNMPAGTAIEKTKEVTTTLENFMHDELQTGEGREHGITHWATYVGESGPRFYLSFQPDPPTPEAAVLVAFASDRDAAENGVSKVREFIARALPDARATVEPRALGPPSTAPVVFQVSGPDQERVFSLVDVVKAKLETLSGTTNIRDDWGQRVKKLRVDIDRERARRAGLTNQDVAVSLQTALSGLTVTQYREDSDVIPVVMRSTLADRDDIGKIESLSVFSLSTGNSVPLNAIADVNVVWEPSQIRRRDRLQTVSVMSNLDLGVTSASINAQVIPWLEEQAKSWDIGYRWRMAGEMEQAEKGNKSINDKMPIAMFLITMLLVLQFNSLRRPLIILLTIPLAVVGVAGGLLVFDSYFGFMTLLGVIALFGIVINNAIVLIDRIEIEINENGLRPQAAIIEAAQRRLRPILLTTFTTILGLIPLWIGGGPMWKPMAISIVCGLAFSTLLTLGVVPLLYSLFFRVRYTRDNAAALCR
jgi:multidrug efflux pump subunit AcrB